jgi:hypothetical protein
MQAISFPNRIGQAGARERQKPGGPQGRSGSEGNEMEVTNEQLLEALQQIHQDLYMSNALQLIGFGILFAILIFVLLAVMFK